ncbi:hypothetical protein GQ44DRAFT_709988 [Phaeosphaeriaceae sp. PMI808]|nr:hypothetical protein GQ44DRAFT_709988 [Phaeosphaeriaceae sp. PMI808]
MVGKVEIEVNLAACMLIPVGQVGTSRCSQRQASLLAHSYISSRTSFISALPPFGPTFLALPLSCYLPVALLHVPAVWRPESPKAIHLREADAIPSLNTSKDVVLRDNKDCWNIEIDQKVQHYNPDYHRPIVMLVSKDFLFSSYSQRLANLQRDAIEPSYIFPVSNCTRVDDTGWSPDQVRRPLLHTCTPNVQLSDEYSQPVSWVEDKEEKVVGGASMPEL